ncbi:cytosine permease [Bacillus sp. JJ1773]|uniref:purine-cytosine permease family protein n=1 Tax=Bacillus sp. JJ1773 TaxID=3122965 RepID=UPI002FFFF095
MSDKNNSILKDITQGFVPSLASERIFGFWDLVFVQFGIATSSLLLLYGGYTGVGLNAKDSIIAIAFSNAVPVFLTLPITVLFARYGIDTFVAFRSALGYLGSNFLFFLFAVLNLGYIAIIAFMAGQAAIHLTGLINAPAFLTSRGTGAPLFSIIFFIIAYAIAYRGPLAIRKFTRIGVPMTIVTVVILGSILFYTEGFGGVFALEPVENGLVAPIVEMNMGLGFSYLLFMGQYARLVKKEKDVFNASFLSWAILAPLVIMVGALFALKFRTLEPTDWMFDIGGAFFGSIFLAVLIIANLTVVTLIIYSQGVSFKTVFPKQKWSIGLGTTIPCILLILNSSFYDVADIFMTMVGYVIAVLGGIVISDFYLVKKQVVNVRELYNPNGTYRYWKGINPAAVVSLVIGTVVYWIIYNPLTGESSVLFNFTTASIVTYFVSLISYYVSSRYIFAFKEKKKNQYINRKSV